MLTRRKRAGVYYPSDKSQRQGYADQLRWLHVERGSYLEQRLHLKEGVCLGSLGTLDLGHGVWKQPYPARGYQCVGGRE